MEIPEDLKLTQEEQQQLSEIQAKAKVRHERARRAAAKQGRTDFPMLPYECSWAYEQEFLRERLRRRES